MELKITDEIHAIMLFESLPISSDNVRCEIESRD